jgi:hypothetical protein
VRKGSSRQYRMRASSSGVDQMMLDEFVGENYIEHIDLLRFDCYGSEYQIFRSGTKFLEITDMICLTMHKVQVVSRGTDVSAERKHIMGCLKRSGFERICTFGKGARKHVFQLWSKNA